MKKAFSNVGVDISMMTHMAYVNGESLGEEKMGTSMERKASF